MKSIKHSVADSTPLVRFGHFGAGHGGKHSAKRPRTEHTLEPGEQMDVIVRGFNGGKVRTDGVSKGPADTRTDRLALPDGLKTQAKAVLVGNRITVSRADRKRGIVARNFMLYSV